MRRDTVIKLALEANEQKHVIETYEFDEDQLAIFAGLIMDRCVAMCFAVAKQKPGTEWARAGMHCGFSIGRDRPRIVVDETNQERA